MGYEVKLEVFEGPLDLLLHLIKKHEIDIFDIPIAFITQQYLEYVDLMSTLNLDLAGEFLVMAATLTKVKSQMLLPPDETAIEGEDDAGQDPRAELVQRLLEYQRYKDAAEVLEKRQEVWRDVFPRRAEPPPLPPAKEADLLPGSVSLFDLLDSLRKVLDRVPDQGVREITLERITVSEKITYILSRLKDAESLIFEDLFDRERTRLGVIVTFLALLELVRIRAVRVVQVALFGPIHVTRAVPDDPPETLPASEAAA